MTTLSPTSESSIECQRGDDRPILFPATDTTGAPVDLTGWPVTAWCWSSRREGSPLQHEWSTGAGSALAEPGQVVLLVDDSRDWPWERGYFEVQLTWPNGAHAVLATGSINVRGHPSSIGTLPPPTLPYTKAETDTAITTKIGLHDASAQAHPALRARLTALETAPAPPASFLFEQVDPSTVWLIAHNLPFVPAGVAVVDNVGNEHHPLVSWPDATHVQLVFNTLVRGTARLS